MRQLVFIVFTVVSIQLYSQKPFPDSLWNNMEMFDKIHSGYEDPGWSFDKFLAKTTSGIAYTADSLKNKISFINFWFEGCHPCEAEFPSLNDLYVKYKDSVKFQFLSFTFDMKENAMRMAEKYQLKYPIICFDQSSILKLNHGLGYPLTMLVDRHGTIRFIECGGSLKEADIKRTVDVYAKEIEKLLKE